MKSLLCVGAVLGLASASMAATLPPPPPTPTEKTADTIQGVKIADPYRWLEDWSNAKVQAWSAAQNTRTRSYLDALPSQGPVKAELTRLVSASSPSFFGFQPRGAVVFATFSDPKLQQPVIVTLNAKADPASKKILLDPNTLDPSGHTAIDWYEPSADGSKIAVSLSQNGSEAGTLHIYDVATGKEIETPIARVQYPTAGGSMAWAADGKGFWYTRYPGTDAPADEQHFNMQVYFHDIGSDAAKDPLVLGSKDGLERISEIFLDNAHNLNRILVRVQRGDGGIWSYYVLEKNKPALRIGKPEDQIVYAAFGPDGGVYAISRKGTSNGRVVKLDAPVADGLATAKVLVPETDVAIESSGGADLAFSKDRLFVRDIVGGPNQVRIFTFDGKLVGKLPLPDISSNGDIVELADGQFLFSVSSFLRPVYYEAWNPATGAVSETELKVDTPVHFDDAVVTRVFATSKDGTKVPLNIILKKGTKLDGTNPTLLYGYGGYGVNMKPGFIGAFRRLWLDAGGIYVLANIRGGAEYGEKWHTDGMLTKKQNVFDDFHTAAQYLIDQKYTRPAKLALMGGSNGGLLMGTQITQHPATARAVISSVGIYDMIRVELDPNGAFNTTEFGTVKNPADFKVLYGYSPYHHVVAKTAYPAVLMTTGATDGRVNPMQSRKFTAALQAASSSGHPILLRTNMHAGHGIGSSMADRIAEQTDMLCFLFDQLGTNWKK